MLSKSAGFTLDREASTLNIMVTPLFLQNHNQPWQPNEIYEIAEAVDADSKAEPQSLGKIIVDDQMNWRYEGEHQITDEEVEQIARFVMSQV